MPALMFVMVLAIVLGMYWTFVERPERVTDSALRRRLGGKALGSRAAAGVQREARRLSNVPVFHRLLTSRENIVGPLASLVEQSGVKTTVSVILLASACLFMLSVLAVQWWAGALWMGALLGAALAWVPVLYLQWKRSRRVQRFEELFPEALDLMSRSMRAGHTFISALGMVSEELPEPIAAEFKLLHDQQNFGMPLAEALRAFGERVPLLTAKFFVTAILTQREAGGNLTEVLDNLSSVIRDRFNVMRQVRIKSAHGRVTGWILVALPPSLALVLSMVNPGHFADMLDDRFGTQLIVAAIVLQIVGAFIIRKIVNVEY
jgi:tight adherence protein B